MKNDTDKFPKATITETEDEMENATDLGLNANPLDTEVAEEIGVFQDHQRKIVEIAKNNLIGFK